MFSRSIKTIIFDLDGTLVQTEKLKALSYAKAVVELCPQAIQEAEVIERIKMLLVSRAERSLGGLLSVSILRKVLKGE